jgi:septum formation protein
MHFKSSKFYFNNISSTTYQFLEFKQSDIDAYIKSGDWMGKAGACMIEGFCKPYIWSVHGLESNAMGLGVEVLQGWIDFLKN